MRRLLQILPFIFTYCSSRDPEITMNAEQLTTYWNYPFEETTAQTDDGYILKLFRIKHGNNCSSSDIGPPFLLAHGLGAAADHWLMNPPASNPAFILADAGFDVWLMNFRGARNGSQHVKFKPNDREFWNFTWDQMAEFDLPAAVDTVLRVSGAARLYYVGHSQGTTALFAKLARDPASASKIARFFALAPITTAKYMRGPKTGLYFMHSGLQATEELLGGQEYAPATQMFGNFVSEWICPFAELSATCESILALMGGPSAKGVFNVTRSLVYLAHYSGTSSIRNFIHWGQMIWRDGTRMYDFGSASKNQIHYGQPTPPVYNFTAIRNVSIHLFYSANDLLASAEDVEKEMQVKHLSKDVVKEAVKVPGYAHFDFIYSMTLKAEIMDRIVDVIRNEDGFRRDCEA